MTAFVCNKRSTHFSDDTPNMLSFFVFSFGWFFSFIPHIYVCTTEHTNTTKCSIFWFSLTHTHNHNFLRNHTCFLCFLCISILFHTPKPKWKWEWRMEMSVKIVMKPSKRVNVIYIFVLTSLDIKFHCHQKHLLTNESHTYSTLSRPLFLAKVTPKSNFFYCHQVRGKFQKCSSREYF